MYLSDSSLPLSNVHWSFQSCLQVLVKLERCVLSAFERNKELLMAMFGIGWVLSVKDASKKRNLKKSQWYLPFKRYIARDE